jgi:hypothetical protein
MFPQWASDLAQIGTFTDVSQLLLAMGGMRTKMALSNSLADQV